MIRILEFSKLLNIVEFSIRGFEFSTARLFEATESPEYFNIRMFESSEINFRVFEVAKRFRISKFSNKREKKNAFCIL